MNSRNIVLIGFAEALSAPEVAWSLVDAGFQVVAFARKGRPSALRHSRYVTCHEICPPEADLQQSLSDLQRLVASSLVKERQLPAVLFPLDDKAVWLSSRTRINHPWVLAGPRGPQAELALNKCLQLKAAHEAGFRVPAAIVARRAAEVFEFADQQSYPLILKPSECVPVLNGRLRPCKKWSCANRAELEQAVSKWAEKNPLIVQQFVSGTGEGVFGLSAPDGVRAWSGHRRVRMMNPQGSGSSVCMSQPVSEDIRSKCEQIIRDAGWQGLFMIELLRDSAGDVWFIELNGRPWGSMALCRRQGLEYPSWNVDLALDKNSRVGCDAPEAKMIRCRHAGRDFMHLLFVARGPRSKAFTEWPSMWKTLINVGHIRRGDTVYNWRSDDPKVFISDFWYTIKDNVFKPEY